jgi:Protein kinase domain
MLKSGDDVNDPRVKRQKTVGESNSAAQIPQVAPSSSASIQHVNNNLSDHVTRSNNDHAGGLDRFRNEPDVQTPLETPKPGKSVGLSDSFRDWKVGDRYQLIRLLGRGSYGEVAQAMDIFAKQVVAIKRITSAFQQDIDALRLYREIHILRRLRGHDCIINLIDVVQPLNLEEFQDLYLVFECKLSNQLIIHHMALV